MAIWDEGICPCGSGLARFPIIDPRGIFCCFACTKCAPEKRKKFKPEQYTNPVWPSKRLKSH